MGKRNSLIIGSVASVLMMMPEIALAQAFEDEIVVTAQRRSQSVQDVAATINAYSGEQLDKYRFDEVEDVSKLVPNVDIKQSIGGTNAVITIRGVGLNDFSSNNTGSVGVYVDDVFLASTASLEFSSFDTERLEVLKGPQGTLYGRNTTGGAINIISRKPSQTPGGYISVGAGNFSLFEGEAAVTGPLSENVSYRLSGKITDQGESFYTQIPSGDDFGGTTAFGLRGQLAYEGDAWDANLKLQFSDTNGAPTPYKLFGTQTPDSSVIAQDVANNVLFFPEFAPLLATDPSVGLGGVGAFCAPVLAGNTDPVNCANLTGFTDTLDNPRVSASNFAAADETDIETFDATLNLTKDFGAVTLTSITGYRTLDRTFGEDVDASALTLLEYAHDTEVDQFSQELRFNWSNDSWDAVFGGFFSIDTVDHTSNIFSDDLFLTRLDTSYEQDTTSYAGFIDVNYAVSDIITLKGGLRLTIEDKDYVGGTTDLNPNGISLLLLDPDTFEFFPDALPLSFTDVDIDETDVSGRIGVDIKASDSTLLYATISKGFKTGGVIGDITFSNEELTPFNPETVYAYEAGLKSDLSESLRFNASVFYYDYRDIQTFVEGSLGPVLGNADDADVFGADIELAWKPIDALSINAGLGLLDTELGAPFDGNNLPNAPSTTFTGLANYDIPVSDGLNLALQGGVKYASRTERDADNTPVTASDSYTIFNGRITLEALDSGWEFAIWGENIGDEDFAQQTFFLPTIGSVIQSFNAPRTYGASVTKRF